MGNRKIYLYDNGFASATHYTFSEDRGKLLENLVFAKLRVTTEEIYFLKNGFECDFAVFPRAGQPLLVQVTERLDRNNLDREVKGLAKARQRIVNSCSLIVAGEITVPLDMLPEWVEITTVTDWLLAGEGM